jgi:hypothetical protein
MRVPKLPPTPGARRLKDIPIKEFYLGFKVRSLMTGTIGIVGDYEDHWDNSYWLDILWVNGRESNHPQYEFDMVEELLGEKEV